MTEQELKEHNQMKVEDIWNRAASNFEQNQLMKATICQMKEAIEKFKEEAKAMEERLASQDMHKSEIEEMIEKAK